MKKHRMTRREFLRTAGLGTTGLILAACNPTEAPTAMPQPKAEEPTATPQPKAEEPTPVPEEEAVVRVFNYDPTGTDAWVEADALFDTYFAEKYPSIEIQIDQAPWAGFTEKLLTSIAGGAEYDVIYGYWQWLPQFIENEVVGPLDEVIAADPDLSEDDFFDFAKEMVDGKIFGLGWFVSGWLHWINRTTIQEKGYTDPWALAQEGKWDYDAWYDFAQQLTFEQDGIPYFGYSMDSIASVSVYNMLAWAWGTDMWDEGFNQCIMDNETNVYLWEWVQKFYSEGLTPMPGTSTEDNPIGYTNGLVAGMLAGQWFTRNIVQDGAPDMFDIGMVSFPEGPDGSYSVAAMNSFYFGKSPEHPDAAWTWYKERSFSEKSSELYALIGGGRFPSRKSVSPAVVYEWEDVQVYDAIRPTLRAYSVSPKESEFIELWNAAWDEMVLEMRPVPEILGQLAQEATELVNE